MERNWGEEILVGVLPPEFCVGCTGKILRMKPGGAGNPQIHHRKFESGYIFSGRLKVSYDPGEGVMVDREVGPGDIVYIPTGAVHQEEALTECVIFEISSPHGNDRFQVAEAYGRELRPGALASTTLGQVTTWSLDDLEPA